MSASARRVIGATGDVPAVAELAEGPMGLRLLPTDETARKAGPDSYLSPGWIDLHTHVFDGTTSISVHPDRAGYPTGVTLVVDAGSAGEATVDGLFRYVAPSADTPVVAWLNIGSHGLVHLREVADLSWIDVDRTLEAIDRHRPVICGVKVRSSGLIVGPSGLQPLQLARLVARAAKLPIMVHIGEAPPLIADVLDLLDEGDVVTHCYHGKTGSPWNPNGTPSGPLRAALERGVLLDVGHGAASFSASVARRALAAGWAPSSISTDLHVRNIDGPVHSLAATMTKMLALGMPLDQIIDAVTNGPGRVVHPDPWLGEDSTLRRATIFRLEEVDGTACCADSRGEPIAITRRIVPEGVIIDGRLLPCGADVTGPSSNAS